MTNIRLTDGEEQQHLRFEHSEYVWADQSGGLWFFDGGLKRWQNINPLDKGGFWVDEEGGEPVSDYAPYRVVCKIQRGDVV